MLVKVLTSGLLAIVLIAGTYGLTVSDRADCTDILANSLGYRPVNGRFHLLVGEGRRPVWAYCDLTTDERGWTIIQKRTSGELSFYQPWAEYENGFGDINGDHWLGNTYIHSITYGKRYLLRIEFTDWADVTHYAEYDNFRVGGIGCNYTLESVGKFCGDCGDSLTYQLNSEFSTFDRDNDESTTSPCAVLYKGAWWYKDCHHSNLNGAYKGGGIHMTYADGINWQTCGGYYYSYKSTRMMIRPIDF